MSESTTSFLTAEKPSGLRRYLPILGWMGSYRPKRKLASDAIAGVAIVQPRGRISLWKSLT